MTRQYGMRRGKIFPARHARSLLNPLRRLVQSPQRIVKRMQLAPADRVLEIGCGPGYFSPSIAAAVAQGSLVLFDLQQAMLDAARLRLGACTNVDFVNGDAMSLPFSDGSFDAALAVFVLGEVPDPERHIAELARVVRQGGTITFGESWRDSDFTPFPQLCERLGRHGLELMRKYGPPWEYTARFRRG
jgi:ubiquinone/menaquinone biosynthesis C-methylase UbiE